ncbi:MAG TPA: inositol monophosphatase family protein [Streptosporangiales bacterium]
MSASDADVAVAAAQAGAAVVRERYGTPLARYEKAPTDFATDADVEAERAVSGVLRAMRPGDACEGEELGASGHASSDRTWLVDPLCGTLNFAARTPLAAVNVALRQGERVSVAACADPFAAEVFWTDGHGARVRRGDRDEVLSPSAGDRLVEVNLDGPHPNADWFRAAWLLADPAFSRTFRPRVVATTLALAWVAAGRRAAYVTDGRLRGSVHFSCGIALCQAAGCRVTGLRGQPLHTGVGGLVVAADRDTHAALVEFVGRRLATRGGG